MTTINEGLREGELEDLVKPWFSIDIHKPKIGEERDTVVVAFYCRYEDPAKDLSTFIEKGPYNTLDVDVSPSPDTNNNWLVFCEFDRDDNLYDSIKTILDNIVHITNITDWKFRAYRHEDILEFEPVTFKDAVITSKAKYYTVTQLEEQQQVRKRMEFLRTY